MTARRLLLHSGGLDSHVCWLLDPSLLPVYVRHGAGGEAAELAALVALAAADPRFRFVVVDGPPLPTLPDGHVAFRNLLLLSTALAVFPDAVSVAYGALLGEGSRDKSRAFRRALERAWRESEGRCVRVVAPLRWGGKAAALRRVAGLPGAEFLGLTVSCYHGSPACGRCQACFRRGVAEFLVGWRRDWPAWPVETAGVVAALRGNRLHRWPALAAANCDVAAGLLLRAWRGVRGG